jgi:hypothetical protein
MRVYRMIRIFYLLWCLGFRIDLAYVRDVHTAWHSVQSCQLEVPSDRLARTSPHRGIYFPASKSYHPMSVIEQSHRDNETRVLVVTSSPCLAASLALEFLGGQLQCYW